VSNSIPVGHPMGDRLDSKSWERFSIMELGRYIILIGSQFIATCLLFVCLFQYEWHICICLISCLKIRGGRQGSLRSRSYHH
jgi:hypothetical protein